MSNCVGTLSLLLLLIALSSSSPKSRRQAQESCECVPYYLCKDGSVLTSGEGLLDIRNLPAEKPPPEIASKNPCGSFHVCCQAPEHDSVITTPAAYVPRCGQRHEEGLNTRILNPLLDTDEAKLGEFPWQAAILRNENGANIFVCGGTLIHQQFIVTAAHCVYNVPPEILKVRLGEYDTQSTGEFYPHADLAVSAITIHPEFYKGALYNNIALLELKEPAPFAPNIDTACLPAAGDTFTGLRCFISGWGKSAFGKSGSYQSLLKKVEVPIIPNDECQTLLQKTRLGKYFQLHPSFICAGGELGKDACKGDGGGPLVCQRNNVYHLAGLVAWGIGCGQENVPGVYVKVSQFTQWIDNTIAMKTLQ